MICNTSYAQYDLAMGLWIDMDSRAIENIAILTNLAM